MHRLIQHALAASIILLCAVTARAELTLDVRVNAGAQTNTFHRELITIKVTQDGAAAPAGTEVTIERIEGDAMLFETDTKLSTSVKTTATNGTAKFSIAMRTEPRAVFLITAVDPNDATNTGRRMLTVDALDGIPGGRALKCAGDERLDCREDGTYFTFYSGYAVNTFATAALSGQPARNATASDIIAGLDFGHAIFRRREGSGRGELWIYGETVHGVTSTNNCEAEGDEATCDEGDDPTNTLTGVIEDATTLEAYAGLRYEFRGLPWLDETASRLYVKGQAGFISILGKGVDLVDNHHAGLGLMKVHGRFTDSYFEVGYGRNDLFKVRNKGRWKVDALVSMNTKWPETALIRPFIQLTADTDLGSGEDSVQTFFGLDFDLTLLEIFAVPGRGRGR